MKLTLAVHHFPPAYRGGAELASYRLASGLRDRGWQVQIACVERVDAGASDGLQWEDTTFEGLAVRRLAFDLAKVPDRWRWSYDNPWIGRHLETWWQDERPDAVLLVGGYLMTGSVLTGAARLQIPSVVRATDMYFLCPRITMQRSDGTLSEAPVDAVRCARCLGEESRRYRIPGRMAPGLMNAFWRLRRGAVRRVEERNRRLREALALAATVVTPSRFLRDLLVAGGADPARVIHVPWGVDPIPCVRTAPATPLLRIGYLGQIVELKGVHILLEALRKLPDAPLSLDLYGDHDRDPAYTARLRRLSQNDPRIRWHGLVTSPVELRAAWGGIDLLCVPSLWHENSPNVIHEAYAAGTPVLASDVRGIAEIVGPGHGGLLFRMGDAAHLAGELQEILKRPDRLRELRAGIPRLRSVAQEVGDIDAVLRRAIDRHRGAQAEQRAAE